VIDWSRLPKLHPHVRAKFARVAKAQAMPVDYNDKKLAKLLTSCSQVAQQQNEERGESPAVVRRAVWRKTTPNCSCFSRLGRRLAMWDSISKRVGYVAWLIAVIFVAIALWYMSQ
jgi:hypothetical protein